MAAADAFPPTVRLAEEHGGRGLRTATEVAPGDTVLEDTPLVSCRLPASATLAADAARPGPRRTPACDHCQKPAASMDDVEIPGYLRRDKRYASLWPCGATLPAACPAGCGAAYCGDGCRAAAFAAYHSVECAQRAGVDELNASVAQDKGDGFECGPAVVLAVRLAFYSAAAQRAGRGGKQLAAFAEERPVFFDAVLALHGAAMRAALRNVPEVDEAALQSLLAVSLTNSVTFASSPKHLFYKRVREQTSATLEDDAALDPLTLMSRAERGELEGLTEGVGLYPLMSAANHACVPSCGVNAVATADHALRLVNIGADALPSGASVTLSYLTVNPDTPENDKLLCRAENSLVTRRRTLREHWRFECACDLCTRQEATVRRCVQWVAGNLMTPEETNALAAASGAALSVAERRAVRDAYDSAEAELQMKPQESLATLKQLAFEHGHQPSYHTVGCALAFEDVVERDEAEALRFLAAACTIRGGMTLDAPLSWTCLSELLFEAIEYGSQPTSCLEGAVLLLRAAADQGLPRAQCSLAFYLSEGGMHEAWQWVEAACQQGEASAFYLAAQWAREGKGLARRNLPMGMGLKEREGERENTGHSAVSFCVCVCLCLFVSRTPHHPPAKSLFDRAIQAGYAVPEEDLQLLASLAE